MSMMRYQPWSSFDQLHREINRLFDQRGDESSSSAVADWAPAVDIFELTDRFELQADLPGVDPDSVEVTLENGVLSISGQRHTITPEGEVDRSRIERIAGRFHRRFTLPDTADTERVTARSQHGVLSISIAKREQAKPTRIKVAA